MLLTHDNKTIATVANISFIGKAIEATLSAHNIQYFSKDSQNISLSTESLAGISFQHIHDQINNTNTGLANNNQKAPVIDVKPIVTEALAPIVLPEPNLDITNIEDDEDDQDDEKKINKINDNKNIQEEFETGIDNTNINDVSIDELDIEELADNDKDLTDIAEDKSLKIEDIDKTISFVDVDEKLEEDNNKADELIEAQEQIITTDDQENGLTSLEDIDDINNQQPDEQDNINTQQPDEQDNKKAEELAVLENQDIDILETQDVQENNLDNSEIINSANLPEDNLNLPEDNLTSQTIDNIANIDISDKFDDLNLLTQNTFSEETKINSVLPDAETKDTDVKNNVVLPTPTADNNNNNNNQSRNKVNNKSAKTNFTGGQRIIARMPLTHRDKIRDWTQHLQANMKSICQYLNRINSSLKPNQKNLLATSPLFATKAVSKSDNRLDLNYQKKNIVGACAHVGINIEQESVDVRLINFLNNLSLQNLNTSTPTALRILRQELEQKILNNKAINKMNFLLEYKGIIEFIFIMIKDLYSNKLVGGKPSSGDERVVEALNEFNKFRNTRYDKPQERHNTLLSWLYNMDPVKLTDCIKLFLCYPTNQSHSHQPYPVLIQ